MNLKIHLLQIQWEEEMKKKTANITTASVSIAAVLSVFPFKMLNAQRRKQADPVEFGREVNEEMLSVFVCLCLCVSGNWRV